MGWFARNVIDFRLAALLFGSVGLTSLLAAVAAHLLASLMAYRLPHDWQGLAVFLAVVVLLRMLVPSIVIWLATMAIGRRLRFGTKPAVQVASGLIALMGWVMLIATVWEIFGPRVMHDLALLVLVLVLPVAELIALLLARYLYRDSDRR
ncbi:MAG: hypothetical protein U1E41_08930 [Paracoccus sp. (in: a-proteobacteria)]